eukprot:TRINITY_DN2480_c0_g1_i1.p2 TRINITY_DN2480_c0_g1~~TRINITY_DN2480_c0_g1_i1.p2  ORF type:complete len:122 (-),score=18.26 TRINITY_DN2480_c0_g1_i1:217-582(-)
MGDSSESDVTDVEAVSTLLSTVLAAGSKSLSDNSCSGLLLELDSVCSVSNSLSDCLLDVLEVGSKLFTDGLVVDGVDDLNLEVLSLLDKSLDSSLGLVALAVAQEGLDLLAESASLVLALS